ncbi:HET-domain-containing protein [Hypoxylon trugodes]|uniref:HET-domain-containing protein n=1 Tax=Hypoxylon trugodes TaxID=326681 RepID=UPI00219B2D19|nr:HET-domain-containing protein [Hypoxylon trugodes]KAI1387152.1 HET-domain-containing protein [Hypoxylon trugodes]
MLCGVCLEGLRGIWDPKKGTRLGLLRNFPEIAEKEFHGIDDDTYDEVLGEYEIRSKKPELYVFGHHIDYDSLIRSKKIGCVVCSEIDNVDDCDDVCETLLDIGYFTVFRIDLPRGDRRQPVMLVYSGDPMSEIFHEIVTHDENDEVNSAISHSTSDAQTWAHVQTWVDRCMKGHETCLHQDSIFFAPTRLLELFHSGDEKSFRLIYHDEFDAADRYVTLSHCWGPEPAEKKLRLIDSTRDELRVGRPVSILPKTFRDAFEIIERLGVRHLWIDRLCIVQDSAEDWQAEASTMQSIYSHGWLNIAALGAKDDQAGCFFDRDPTVVSPTVFNLSPPSSNTTTFYRFDLERESWRRDFEGELLLTRGWVLQERILSTRNLYFGSKQVFWECFETNCCETVPNVRLAELDRSFSTPRNANPSKQTWKPLIQPERKGSGWTITDWFSAVETYSQCNLSHSSDKLVAISGLAKRMGDMMRIQQGLGHDVYLAGLWGHTMPRSLLWRPKTHGRRMSSYRAPSWSWASINGGIFLDNPSGSHWHVDVLGTEVVPQGSDVTGKLNGGFLTLRGHVCRARIFKKANNGPIGRELYLVSSFQYPQSDVAIDLEFGSSYVQFDVPNENYEAVAILIFNIRPHKAFSFVDVNGLALVFADESKSSYRRVGYAFLKVTVDFEDENFEKELLDEFPVRVVEIV